MLQTFVLKKVFRQYIQQMTDSLSAIRSQIEELSPASQARFGMRLLPQARLRLARG
jgi:hypothetical protein